MWQELGFNIGHLARRPGREAAVAAAFRQLLRAYEADDRGAAWLATAHSAYPTGSCCMSDSPEVA